MCTHLSNQILESQFVFGKAEPGRKNKKEMKIKYRKTMRKRRFLEIMLQCKRKGLYKKPLSNNLLYEFTAELFLLKCRIEIFIEL